MPKFIITSIKGKFKAVYLLVLTYIDLIIRNVSILKGNS